MNEQDQSLAGAPPTFDALPLSEDVRRALDEIGYTHPTPVQLAAYEPAVSGRDIIVVDLSGSAVTAAGGLWAGASGSPVYFRSGGRDKLAGAIAYGLAGGGSTLAGVTPAEDMDDLLHLGSPARRAAASSIRVPTGLARRMAAARVNSSSSSQPLSGSKGTHT